MRYGNSKDVRTLGRVLDLPVASFANNEYAYALTLRSLALHAHGVSPIVLTHKPAHSVRYPDLLTFVRYIRTQIR